MCHSNPGNPGRLSATPSPSNLFEVRLQALGADAVAELRFRVLTQVLLNLLPLVAVVANPRAVRAHRQPPPKALDIRQRLLEIDDAGSQRALQADDSASDA